MQSRSSGGAADKMYPIIRNIRERASRTFLHDEVQLHDNRIISQMYSSYIKDTKVMLNNCLSPNSNEFLSRAQWLLDAGEEGESIRKGLAEFLIARTKRRLGQLVVKVASTDQTSSLSSQSKRGAKTRNARRKKNVRFRDALLGDSCITESPFDDIKTRCYPGIQEETPEAKIAASLLPGSQQYRVVYESNNGHRSEQEMAGKALSGTNDCSLRSQSRGNLTPAHGKQKSLHGILKNGCGRLLLPANMTTGRHPNEKKARSELKKSSKPQKEIEAGGSMVGCEGAFRTSHDKNVTYTTQNAKGDPGGTWNRSVRLLSGLRLVSAKVRQERTDENLHYSDFLGISSVQRQLGERSLTPEARSQSSISPLRCQNGDAGSMRDAKSRAAHGRKAQRNQLYFETGRRRMTSIAKQGRQYDSIGVGKTAEVTAVSSYVRYDFDIPDDLDANLEHLRIHGYLQS